MIALKLLFCLCVTIFLTYAQVPESHCHLDVHGAKSDAVALQEQLRQRINQAAELVLPYVDGWLQLLDNAAVTVTEKFKRNIKADMEKVLKKIETILNIVVVEKKKIETSECIENIIQDINDIPARFLSHLSYRIQFIITLVEQQFNQLTEEILSTVEIINVLDNQINVCGSEFSGTELSVQQKECFSEISSYITKNIAVLPQIITDLGATMKRLINSALPAIVKCDDKVIEEIVNNATDCIMEEFHEVFIGEQYFN